MNSAHQAGIDDDPDNNIDAGCVAVNCTFGDSDQPLADKNLLSDKELDLSDLDVATVCDKPLGCSVLGGSGALARVRMFRSEVDIRDDDMPVLLEPAGLPSEGQVVSASSLVTFDASDGGGGVMSAGLLVDGNEVAHQDAGGACREPFVRAAPCPAQLTAALPLTISSLSPGTHTVTRARRRRGGQRRDERAGHVHGCTSAADGRRARRRGSGGGRQARDDPPDRDRIALPAKGRRTIAGVVQDETGRLLPGVNVSVRSRPFGVKRAKLRLERTVTTDAFGRFTAPAGVTSRLVILDVNDSANRALEPVEVSVLKRLKVGILTRNPSLRNGSTLMLRASVSGAGSGASGKVVLVQAFVEGRWTTVDSLSAGANGRALWRYRFRSTTRRTGYRFRVMVERAGDVWPWPTTTSRVLRVEVSP